MYVDWYVFEEEWYGKAMVGTLPYPNPEPYPEPTPPRPTPHNPTPTPTPYPYTFFFYRFILFFLRINSRNSWRLDERFVQNSRTTRHM